MDATNTYVIYQKQHWSVQVIKKRGVSEKETLIHQELLEQLDIEIIQYTAASDKTRKIKSEPSSLIRSIVGQCHSCPPVPHGTAITPSTSRKPSTMYFFH